MGRDPRVLEEEKSKTAVRPETLLSDPDFWFSSSRIKTIPQPFVFPLEDPSDSHTLDFRLYPTALRARTLVIGQQCLKSRRQKIWVSSARAGQAYKIKMGGMPLQSCVLSWRSRSGLRFCLNSRNQRRAK